MKPAEFTDAEYAIIVEFVKLLNYWQGNTESTEDFIYTLTEYLNPF
jgi:hypothetical protein